MLALVKTSRSGGLAGPGAMHLLPQVVKWERQNDNRCVAIDSTWSKVISWHTHVILFHQYMYLNENPQLSAFALFCKNYLSIKVFANMSPPAMWLNRAKVKRCQQDLCLERRSTFAFYWISTRQCYRRWIADWIAHYQAWWVTKWCHQLQK